MCCEDCGDWQSQTFLNMRKVLFTRSIRIICSSRLRPSSLCGRYCLGKMYLFLKFQRVFRYFTIYFTVSKAIIRLDVHTLFLLDQFFLIIFLLLSHQHAQIHANLLSLFQAHYAAVASVNQPGNRARYAGYGAVYEADLRQ